VSPGCDHCYAAREAGQRLRHLPLYRGLAKDGRFTGEVRLAPERLSDPIRWRQPKLIFVNSMSDLFEGSVPDWFIAQVWDVMGRSPWHTFLILTKRPGRMRSWVRRWADIDADAAVPDNGGLPPMPRGPEAVRATYRSGRAQLFAEMLEHMGPPPAGAAYPLYDWMEGWRFWPRVLPNVWLGVSVEGQQWADVRIPLLLDTPAAVRWISAEPLLGPINLNESWLTGSPPVDWVVVGGESGPNARPMHPDWARSLRDRCAAAGVPFFFKQAGTVLAREWGARAAGNDPAELPEEFRVRSYPFQATVGGVR
jgi:protein gp37